MQLLEFSRYTKHVNMPNQLTILNIHRLKNPLRNWRNFSSCQQTEEACSLESLSEELAFPSVCRTLQVQCLLHDQNTFWHLLLRQGSGCNSGLKQGPDRCLCSSTMVHKAALIFNSYHQNILLKQSITDLSLGQGYKSLLNLEPDSEQH